MNGSGIPCPNGTWWTGYGPGGSSGSGEGFCLPPDYGIPPPPPASAIIGRDPISGEAIGWQEGDPYCWDCNLNTTYSDRMTGERRAYRPGDFGCKQYISYLTFSPSRIPGTIGQWVPASCPEPKKGDIRWYPSCGINWYGSDNPDANYVYEIYDRVQRPWGWEDVARKIPAKWMYITEEESDPGQEVTCISCRDASQPKSDKPERYMDRGGVKLCSIEPNQNPDYQTDFFVRCGNSTSDFTVNAMGKEWHPCASVGDIYMLRNFGVFEAQMRNVAYAISGRLPARNNERAAIPGVPEPNSLPELPDWAKVMLGPSIREGYAKLLEAIGRMYVKSGIVAGVIAGASVGYAQAVADTRNDARNFLIQFPFIPPPPPLPGLTRGGMT